MFNGDNFRFSLVQWCYWSGHGVLFAFFTAYLQYIGYRGIQIGFVMSLVSGAAIVGQPLMAYFADKRNDALPVLIFSLAAGLVLSLLLYFLDSRYVLIIALSVLTSLVIQTLPPIIDSWTMENTSILPRLDYGFTRAMGSVGFSITVSIAGNIFDRWTIRLMFPLAAFFFFITILIILKIRQGTEAQGFRVQGVDTQDFFKRIRLFLTGGMITMLICFFLTFTAFRTVQIFLPVLIKELGGTINVLGYSLGVMAFSEVPFMVLSSQLLYRYRDTQILFISLIFFFLRIVVLVFVSSAGWIIAAQLLQGPSFGLFLPAFVHLLNRLAPQGSKAFSQAAGTLATFGLGSVAGSAIGGVLTDHFGVVRMYGLMSLVMAGAVLIYVAACRTNTKIMGIQGGQAPAGSSTDLHP